MIDDHKTVAKLLDNLTERDAIARLDADPVKMVRLAKLLLANDKGDEAIDLARRALRAAPNHQEVTQLACQVLGHGVPNWHSRILRDTARNAAYEAALKRNIRRGARVLEIGTGSGILAMMAARAGAGIVTSCEVHKAVAAVAREIVDRNGFADRVRIVARHSRELAIGQDLEEPADLLVTEIATNDLLGEDILACMEDAVGRLTRPGACIIPSQASLRVCLAQYADFRKHQFASVDGFDLSPFNQLVGPIAVKIGDPSLQLMSDAEDIFAFDFSSGGPFNNFRASVRLSSTGGPVNAIVQWIRIRMDAHGVYENRPAAGAKSSWGAMLHPLRRPINSKPGQCFVVNAGRDRQSAWIWLED